MADREQGRCQLLLPELVQEVALVLVCIESAQQQPASVAVLNLRVMPGRDALRAERARFVEEGLELDLAVAENVGVRRATDTVFVNEMLEHCVPVFACKVARMERNAEPPADRNGIFAVVLCAAPGRSRLPASRDIGTSLCGTAAVVFPVLHEKPGDVDAGLLQQQRRDRRVDATGDAEHDLAARTH